MSGSRSLLRCARNELWARPKRTPLWLRAVPRGSLEGRPAGALGAAGGARRRDAAAALRPVRLRAAAASRAAAAEAPEAPQARGGELPAPQRSGARGLEQRLAPGPGLRDGARGGGARLRGQESPAGARGSGGEPVLRHLPAEGGAGPRSETSPPGPLRCCRASSDASTSGRLISMPEVYGVLGVRLRRSKRREEQAAECSLELGPLSRESGAWHIWHSLNRQSRAEPKLVRPMQLFTKPTCFLQLL